MMKSTKIKWKLKDDIYGVYVNLFCNTTHEKVEQMLKADYHDYVPSEIEKNWAAYAGRVTNKDEENIGYVMFLRHFDWSIEDQGTLAHEIYHLVCYILMDRGLSMNFTDEDMNEAYAYYIGFWTRKIKKALVDIR